MRTKILFAAALGAAATANAAPVQWSIASGGNGHYYEFVGTGATQAQAFANASASTYLGHQGYLATITSQGEQDFLYGLSTSNAWIGAVYASGAWRWGSGPEASKSFFGVATPDINYSYWNSGEPNGNAGEPGATMNWNSGTGQWNDWSPANGAAYVVEYGGLSNGVPEPAGWAMMIGGFGLLGAACRHRRSTVVLA